MRECDELEDKLLGPFFKKFKTRNAAKDEVKDG